LSRQGGHSNDTQFNPHSQSLGNQNPNNFEMDRQSVVPPFEMPRFPWIPPPNNFPPWQNPWFWQLPQINHLHSQM